MTPPESIIKPVMVVCALDTHNTQSKLPEGDLLISCRRPHPVRFLQKLQHSIYWLRSQPHRHNIVVASNHDLLLGATLDHRLLQNYDTRRRKS
jgi:hypothetical protein